MSKSLFLRRDGAVSGPLSNKEVFERARTGELRPGDELSRSESGPWRGADQVAALATIFEGRESSIPESELSAAEEAASAVPLNERPFDVFVSHSNKDKKTADALVHVLEERGTRCWMAPRDITAGSSWAGSIMEAITQCRVFVLILSRNSNTSVQVLQEIERAVNRGLTVVPMRIEDVPPSQDLELFLGMRHWLDAFGGSQPQQLQECATAIQGILGVQGDSASSAPAPTASADSRSRWPVWVAAGVAVLALLGIAPLLLGGESGSTADESGEGEVYGSEVSQESTEPLEAQRIPKPELQQEEFQERVLLRPAEIAAELEAWLPGSRSLEFTSQSAGGWGAKLVGQVEYDAAANSVEFDLQSLEDASKFARFRADLEEGQVDSRRVQLVAQNVADREQRLRLASGSEIVLSVVQGELQLRAGDYVALRARAASASLPPELELSDALQQVFEGLLIADGTPIPIQAGLLPRPGSDRVDLVVTSGDSSAVAFGSFGTGGPSRGWTRRFQRTTESPQNRLNSSPFAGRAGALSARYLEGNRLALGWSKGGVVLESRGEPYAGVSQVLAAAETGRTWQGILRNGALVEEVELRFIQPTANTAGLLALIRTPDERSGLRLLRGTYDANADQFASWPIRLEGQYDKAALSGGTDAAFFHDRNAWARLRVSSGGQLVGRTSSGAELELNEASAAAESLVLGVNRAEHLATAFATGRRFQGRFRIGPEQLEVNAEVTKLDLNRGTLEIALAPADRPSEVVMAKGAIDFASESTFLWSAELVRETGQVPGLGRFEFFSHRRPKSLSLRLLDDGTIFGVHQYETLELEPEDAPATLSAADAQVPALTEPSERFFSLLDASDKALGDERWTTASSKAAAAINELTPEQAPFEVLALARGIEAKYQEREALGNRKGGTVSFSSRFDLADELLDLGEEARRFLDSTDERVRERMAQCLCREAQTAEVITFWGQQLKSASGSEAVRTLRLYGKHFDGKEVVARAAACRSLLKSQYASQRNPASGATWLATLDH